MIFILQYSIEPQLHKINVTRITKQHTVIAESINVLCTNETPATQLFAN